MTKLTSEAPDKISFAVIVRDSVTDELIQVPPVFINAPFTQFGFDYRQKKNIIQTRGGHVEFHWGDELDTISGSAVTMAFIGEESGGITSALREGTEGYEDFRAFLELYKNNGTVTDERGKVISSGNIILLHDIGRYVGFFDDFAYSEEDTDPHRLKLTFTFVVEQTDLLFASSVTGVIPGQRPTDFNFNPPANVRSLEDLGQFIEKGGSRLIDNLTRELKRFSLSNIQKEATARSESRRILRDSRVRR